MTREQLRRRFIVSTPDPVSNILKEAFQDDDETKRVFDESSFFLRFHPMEGYHAKDVSTAYDFYMQYLDELRRYEPSKVKT